MQRPHCLCRHRAGRHLFQQLAKRERRGTLALLRPCQKDLTSPTADARTDTRPWPHHPGSFQVLAAARVALCVEAHAGVGAARPLCLTSPHSLYYSRHLQVMHLVPLFREVHLPQASPRAPPPCISAIAPSRHADHPFLQALGWPDPYRGLNSAIVSRFALSRLQTVCGAPSVS